ncbi:peptidoglycan/LPS O-acetylase OafA/YrhL [Bradyrhizobium sp. GM5.1]
MVRDFMKSSSGLYFSRLDHIRALAAYLVFVWHFTHLTTQFPVPFSTVPPFPFALVEEGHVGVGLFMTLSGYLFAKLVKRASDQLSRVSLESSSKISTSARRVFGRLVYS